MSAMLNAAFKAAEHLGVRESDVQRSYAKRISDVIACAREHGHGQGLIEAETGTGKTLGYLIPALLDAAANRSRVVISTCTLQLQQQILTPEVGDMAKAIQAVEEATGVRLTAAKLVGRRNFVDVARVRALHAAVLAAPVRSAEKRLAREMEWDRFLEWAESSSSGELREYLEEEGKGSFPGGFMAEDVCLTDKSSKENLQRFRAHSAKAKAADVLVTNHALLVRSGLSGVNILHNIGDSRPLGTLIVDECDRLPDVARDATSDLLPLHEFEMATRYLESLLPAKTYDALRLGMSNVRDLLEQEAPHGDLTDKESFVLWDELDTPTREGLRVALERLVKTAVVADEKIEHDEHTEVFEDYLRIAKAILAQVSGDGHLSGLVALRWSPKRSFPSFRLFRLFPSRVLKRLWSHEQVAEDEVDGDRVEPIKATTLIMTSATISAPSKSGQPNFFEIQQEIGLYSPANPCAHLYGSFSPTNFGEAQFVVPDPAGPYPFLETEADADEDSDGDGVLLLNPDWVAYASDMAKAAHKEGGRVLVLTTSYRATEAIAAVLRKARLPVIEKTALRTLADCVEKVIAAPNAIFLSPGAWEGLDLKSKGVDNAFRHVVITQLPYRPSDGARDLAIQRHLTRKGKSLQEAKRAAFADSRSAALRKFRQGVGRGIRDRKDRMVLWVADPRFPSPAVFNADSSGAVPARLWRVHPEFAWAIPRRFRVGGFGSAFEDDSRMFLASKKMISAGELSP